MSSIVSGLRWRISWDDLRRFVGRSWRGLTQAWPAILEAALGIASLPTSVAVGVLAYVRPPVLAPGWEWSAFQGLGGMAGFMLAAIALMQAASAAPSMSSWVVAPEWNDLVRALTRAMWWWTIGATASLVCWLLPGPPQVAVFLGCMVAGVLQGLRSLLWVSAIVRRFRNDVE